MVVMYVEENCKKKGTRPGTLTFWDLYTDYGFMMKLVNLPAH